jgi:hypothetical protein
VVLKAGIRVCRTLKLLTESVWGEVAIGAAPIGPSERPKLCASLCSSVPSVVDLAEKQFTTEAQSYTEDAQRKKASAERQC